MEYCDHVGFKILVADSREAVARLQSARHGRACVSLYRRTEHPLSKQFILACVAVQASFYMYITACKGKTFLLAVDLCFGNSSEQLLLLSQPLAS